MVCGRSSPIGRAVADSLIQRVYRESVGRVVDDRTHELLDALRAYPDVQPDGEVDSQHELESAAELYRRPCR